MSSTRNRILVVALPVGAILISALLILRRPEPPRMPPPDRVATVTTEAVRPGSGAIPVLGNGTVRPRAEVELAAQVGGRAQWVSPSLVSGGRVRAGEVLVRIEQADYLNAVAQARAQVAQDSVAILQAEEESRIARDEYEQFRARRGSEAGEPSPLVLREPQLQAARASLARSIAQLADAELALARTELRAPFDGMVRSETVDPGSLVAVGQGVARLFATDVVEVVVPLSDVDAAVIPGLWELRPGDAVDRVAARVVVDYGGRRYAWDGWVDRAETALDEQSRTIDVVVRVADPLRPGAPVETGVDAGDPPPLLVGQYVEVQISGRSGDYQVVPRRALRPGNEVWAVADSVVRIVPVRVLQQAGDSVFVEGRFEAGESVIVAGTTLATDGMRVRRAG
ncbi:MAG: efflux RND transporter periplasmic adaptor subunit, partial [Gemmatimonadetes bacterium]|nr:efflux RND transporter periplasmic adaptor subunit [Gemmatimonadota bacterium]